MIDLGNALNIKLIPKNENPEKVTNIFENILHFDKQQKIKGLKMLTAKQILQRLPVVVVKIKAVDASENFLNEICTMHSSYIANEITKTIYDIVMNSLLV